MSDPSLPSTEEPLKPFSTAPEEVRRVDRALKRGAESSLQEQPRGKLRLRELEAATGKRKGRSQPTDPDEREEKITRLEEELLVLLSQRKPSAKRIREIDEEIAELELQEKKRANVRRSTELSSEASSSGFTLNVSLHSLISDTSANLEEIEEEVRKAADEQRVSDMTINSLRSQISKASTVVDSLASRVSTIIEPSIKRVEDFVRSSRSTRKKARAEDEDDDQDEVTVIVADEIENIFNSSRSSLDEIEIELDEIADRQKMLDEGMKRAMETKRGAAQKRGRAEVRKNKEQDMKRRLVAVADGIEQIVNLVDQAADLMQNVEDEVVPQLTPVDMAFEAVDGVLKDADMQLKEKDAALEAAIDGLSDREIVALRARLRQAGLMNFLTIRKGPKGKYFIRGNGIK